MHVECSRLSCVCVGGGVFCFCNKVYTQLYMISQYLLCACSMYVVRRTKNKVILKDAWMRICLSKGQKRSRTRIRIPSISTSLYIMMSNCFILFCCEVNLHSMNLPNHSLLYLLTPKGPGVAVFLVPLGPALSMINLHCRSELNSLC